MICSRNSDPLILENLQTGLEVTSNYTAKNILLSSKYTAVLAAYPPKGYQTKMIEVKDDEVLGIALINHFEFRLSESISLDDFSWYKKWLAKLVNIEVLECGNALLSGENGFEIKPGISPERFMKALRSNLDAVYDAVNPSAKPGILMVKDIPATYASAFKNDTKEWRNIEVQQSMYMSLCHPKRPGAYWHSFEDYLKDLSSKYRVRAKRARKKFSGLERVEFSLDDIVANSDRLYALYELTASRADFNSVVLDRSYLQAVKEQLKDDFRLVGYYFQGALIGFRSWFHNGDILATHVVGTEQRFNRSHELYLNLLLDYVQIGTECGYKFIDFSRTAREIKSSVGAIEEPLNIYVKPKQWLVKRVFSYLFKYMEPVEPFVPRYPFRNLDQG